MEDEHNAVATVASHVTRARLENFDAEFGSHHLRNALRVSRLSYDGGPRHSVCHNGYAARVSWNADGTARRVATVAFSRTRTVVVRYRGDDDSSTITWFDRHGHRLSVEHRDGLVIAHLRTAKGGVKIIVDDASSLHRAHH